MVKPTLIRTFEVEIETSVDDALLDKTILDEIQSALESAFGYELVVRSVKAVTATVAKRPNAYLPARHPQSAHRKGV